MHYKDADFGNYFFSLFSTTGIMNKDTINVVRIQEPFTVTLTLTESSSLSNIDGSGQHSDDRKLKYSCSGILFGTKDLLSLLPDIFGSLAEVIFEYTAYPSSEQLSQVAEALIKKHPCLKEPGCLRQLSSMDVMDGSSDSNIKCTTSDPKFEVSAVQKLW